MSLSCLPRLGDGARRALELRRHAVVRNATWLMALQIATYALPLFTVPYVTRALGVATFGRVAVAANITAYASLFIEWGSNLGATQQVAQSRHDQAALADIFWTTVLARSLLATIAAVVIGLLCGVPQLGSLSPLLIASLFALVASALNADWFLQGVERMGVLASATIAVRVVSVPLIILLVRTPADAWIFVLLNGLVALGAASFSFAVAAGRVPLRLPDTPLKRAWRQILDHRHLFVSRLSIALYTASTPVLLGLVAGPYAVGLFAGAEKISRVPLQLLNQLSTAVYPRMNAVMKHDSDRSVRVTRLILLIQGLIGAGFSIFLFAAAPILVKLLLGGAFLPAMAVLRWLSALPVLIALSNVLGVQTMVVLGMHRTFSAITLASAAVYAVGVLTLGRSHGAEGAAAAQAVSEGTVLILLISFLFHQQPEYSRGLFARTAANSR